MIVHELMTPDPVTVRRGTLVKDALRLLDESRISSMPVVDDDRHICGVVSEADLIKDLVGPDQRLHLLPVTAEAVPPPRRVDEVMSSPAVTVRPDSDLADAISLVTSTGIKCLPVVDSDGRVVGVISRRDVVRVLARPDDELADQVDALLVAAGMHGWSVDVRHGAVEIDGPRTAHERSLAETLARAVPGVVAVTVARADGAEGATWR